MDKVSVIVPAYNKADLTVRTVESILELLACGMSQSEIVSDYPALNEKKNKSSINVCG